MGKILIPKGGNDRIYTPPDLAERIVRHYLPVLQKTVDDGKKILEPCAGKGSILRELRKAGFDWKDIIALELDKGKDFFKFHDRVGCIITNPPWSKAREFFAHAYEIADDIIWLITTNHIYGMKARIRDMKHPCRFSKNGVFYEFAPRAPGFEVIGTLPLETPALPWPQSGFHLGATHIRQIQPGHVSTFFPTL